MKSTILLALALSTAMASAQADDTLPLPPLGVARPFSHSVNGPFVDYYTFTPSSFGGKVSVDLVSTAGPVVFFATSINDHDFGFPSDLAGRSAVHFEAFVTNDTPLTLTVFGASMDALGADVAGSYAGTVTATVPEPETYALFLAGLCSLGLAGASKRRLQRLGRQA